MGTITRLSLSLEEDLLESLELALQRTQISNRSEFVRSLLRNHLHTEGWMQLNHVVAVINFTYDHHASGINDALVELQHGAAAQVMVSTHLHLSHHLCLEMLVVQGHPHHVMALEAGLRQLRGVLQVALAPIISDSAQATAAPTTPPQTSNA